MKARRLQAPGNTLIVASLDRRYVLFTAWFLELWKNRFATKPLMAYGPQAGDLASGVVYALAEPINLPEGFWALWLYFWRTKIQTLVILNPDLRLSRKLRLAAFLARVRFRAGFAPLRSVSLLNLSLPFNKEKHHYIHQLKTFFEYLTGEKVPTWHSPAFGMPQLAEHYELPPLAKPYGLIALNPDEQEAEFVMAQFKKLVNLMARHTSLVLLLRSRLLKQPEISTIARSFSDVMTEQALTNTTLVVQPEPTALLRLVANAAWVAAVDAELLNVAGLFAIPSLAIFGPLNERVWQPFSVRSRALTGEFPCRPCTDFPGPVLCTHHTPWACIAGASAELMAASLLALVRRAGGR